MNFAGEGQLDFIVVADVMDNDRTDVFTMAGFAMAGGAVSAGGRDVGSIGMGRGGVLRLALKINRSGFAKQR